MADMHTRRAFLRAAAAAGAAWSAADLVSVDAALGWAAEQAASGRPALGVLTAAQAAVLEAAAERIIPAVDGRAGARETGVVLFIDRALGTFNRAQQSVYADGVRDLDARAARLDPAAAGFAALPPAGQDDVLRQIEQTPFFGALRFDTIVGVFALPAWGGNRGFAGWHMLGLDHQPVFQAPFGYYDADSTKRG